MVYPALLQLMHTPRLPVVDWTDDPCRFKWTRPFRRKTKSGFCACAITFQLASTSEMQRRWYDDRRMTNYEGFGRNQLWLERSSALVIAWMDSRETREKHLERWCRSRYGPYLSRIQVQTVTATITCSIVLCQETLKKYAHSINTFLPSFYRT